MSQDSLPKFFTQYHPIGGSNGYVPLFSSISLENDLGDVKNLLIAIHGSSYFGNSTYERMAKVISSEKKFHNTLLLSPQFYSTEGKKATPYAPGMIVWRNGWWRYGSRNSTHMDMTGEWHSSKIATFDVLDKLINDILAKAPKLETITFFGFSAGGQLVQRYALYGMNSLDRNAADLEITFIPSSPASYMYLSNERPEQPFNLSQISFYTPNTTTDYDRFGYGLKDIDGENVCSYFTSQNLTREMVRNRYNNRAVHYFIGGNDTTQSGWDDNPEAMFQGDSRIFRATAFHEHVKSYFGTTSHTLNVITGVEHSYSGIIESQKFRDLISGLLR